jgi:hypothetical protein
MSGGDEDRESLGGPSNPSDGTFLDTPELSASMMVDNSADKGSPGEGVRNTKAGSVALVHSPQTKEEKIRHTRQYIASFMKGVRWPFKAGVLRRFIECRKRDRASDCSVVWDGVVL